MKLFRVLTATAVAALVVATLSADEAQPQPKKVALPKVARQVQVQPIQVGAAGTQFLQAPLLTTEGVDKLKLTDEQKKKYEKISKEFDEKQKEGADAYKQGIQGANAQARAAAIQTARAAYDKRRTDSLTKVEEV